MKFFLPELYIQLNSGDEDLADVAEEEIDRASDQYNQHWERIKSQLPASVLRFYNEQFLHDADVFAPAVVSQGGFLGQAGNVVLIAQQINTLNADFVNSLACLRYEVCEPPTVTLPVASEVFNRVQPIWLYDEFDVEAPGKFIHRILLSDGRVIQLVFRAFDYEIAWILGKDVFENQGETTSAKAASA